MCLPTDEFIRRFLQHVLPKGFHRIRHYGLFANATRNVNLRQARALLQANAPKLNTDTKAHNDDASGKDRCSFTCRQCGAPMIVVEILSPRHAPRAPPQNQAA